MSLDNNTLLIAFYLTQFHPTKENDEWWGKGFTEWTNVTKAVPLFETHYQPHLPTDFGFYDLRVRATRRDQIKTAKDYGIDGFCYHYYWFSGTRILNEPLDDMLSDQDSNMPFCLCWANENWTRRWDAADHEILIAQKYGPDDDLNFIKDLAPVLRDPRYIRKNDLPYLIVYRPQHLPDASKTIKIWKKYCEEVGLGGIHVAIALTHGNTSYLDYGADSAVEFPPHNLTIGNINDSINFHNPFSGNVMQYESIANMHLNRVYVEPNISRSVFPSWDNTARTGARSLITINSTPENYEFWLAETIRKTSTRHPNQTNFVFINAWNEWAEGCHLEPDRKYGSAFLEATLRAKSKQSLLTSFTHSGAPQSKEEVNRKLSSDLLWVLKYHLSSLLNTSKRLIRRFPMVKKILLPFVNILRSIFK
jgi:lipopolysaccharide biosynthesis protein